MTYSKSSNRESGITQNPATEKDDLLKIQQQRKMTYSKSSKRERKEFFKIQHEVIVSWDTNVR